MDERDIALVAKAFDRLTVSLAHTCDAATRWTIAGPKDDVLDIPSGDWHGDDDHQRNDDARGYGVGVAAGLARWTR